MKKRFLMLAILVASLLFVVFRSMNSQERRAVEPASDTHEKWSGNFDGMVERHLIRVLVPYSRTFYFLDGADQRGLTYEAIQGFERYVNRQLKKQTLKIRVVVIPTSRDRLLSALAEGLGDIAEGNLTITPERVKLVDFADPGYTGVNEIIVSGRRPLQSTPSRAFPAKRST